MRGVILELNLITGGTEEQEMRKNRVSTHNLGISCLRPSIRCVPLGSVFYLLLVVLIIDFGSFVSVFVFKLARKTKKIDSVSF